MRSAYPLLFQVPARDWMLRSGVRSLAQLPDAELDWLAALGFDWLWLLGVWQTGRAGRAVSQTNQGWQDSYLAALPDLRPDDIIGSPFAIVEYQAHNDFGGNQALASLRERLRQRRIHLLLDFVPNHTALDHPWLREHPDYYVTGSEADFAREPTNYTRLGDQGRIFAHGRDPYFPGWPDTLQLNYGNPKLQDAMLEQLRAIAAQCDGVRCDMAMLLLPEVFRRTWGIEAEAFWPKAIAAVRHVKPDFLFLAEVYWGLEWELQQQGFDYTYDKTLYDRLMRQDVGGVKGHLTAGLAFQQKSARFLENHDEPRIAALLPPPVHQAAAMICYFVPGMRFLHAGQLNGYSRKPSVHLARRAAETADPDLAQFYRKMLSCLKEGIGQGDWLLLDIRAAWPENPTHRDFVCFRWLRADGADFVIAVNYADHQSQCYLPLPWLTRGPVWLRDGMGDAEYQRDGEEVAARGLYLDLPPWGYHLFRLST